MWCHRAIPLEVALDRNDGAIPQTRPTRQTNRARQEIAVADRLLEAESRGLNPPEWAELARQAAAIRGQALTDLRARKALQQTISRTRQTEHSLGIGHSPRPGGPELGL